MCFLVSDVKPKLTLLVRQGWSFTIYQVTFSLNSICCFFSIASTNNGQVDNKIGKQLFSSELQVDIYLYAHGPISSLVNNALVIPTLKSLCICQNVFFFFRLL